MPVVDTTRTFTNNEQITSVKLNEIMDNSSFVSGAVVTSGGLEVTAGGQMQVATSGITTTKIANLNVTTEKIANEAVTPAKLSPFGPAWSNGLTNFNIQQNSLELATGITSNSGCFVDFHSVHPLTDFETRIARDTGVDGWFQIDNKGAGRIVFTSAGGFQFANAHMPNPVGSAPIFGIRAWVNFDATRDSSGAVNALFTNRLIRSSGNVTSVLKTATGKFTVTFTFAMPNTNYTVTSSAGLSGSPRLACVDRTTATTTSIEIETDDLTGAAANFTENNVMVIA
jgi:hypothetical protein